MSLAIEYVPLDKVVRHDRNPKAHDVDAIVAAIRRLGFADPVVIDERTGKLAAGHGRLKALDVMREQGDDPPSGIRVEKGVWLVPQVVGWSSANDLEAEAALVILNRTTELGGWVDEALLATLDRLSKADDGFDGLGFGEDAMAGLRIKLARLDGAAPDDDVPAPAPPKIATHARTRLGDLWTVGPHRIICGRAPDSTDAGTDTLDRLLDGATAGAVVTDPPYGIDLNTDYSTMQGATARITKARSKTELALAARGTTGRIYAPVAGDDQPFDAGPLSEYFAKVAEQWWFGANYYRGSLPFPDLSGSWCVWDKRTTEGADDMLGSGFELVWSKKAHQQRMLRHHWAGITARNRGSKAKGIREHVRAHPTEKPISLIVEILDRWAPAGCIVVDPFAGSGTALIAAARTGRIGMGVELSPPYVDVTVSRLQDELGLQATGPDGELFDDRDEAPYDVDEVQAQAAG